MSTSKKDSSQPSNTHLHTEQPSLSQMSHTSTLTDEEDVLEAKRMQSRFPWLDARLLVVVGFTSVVMLILLIVPMPTQSTYTTANSWGKLEPFHQYQSDVIQNQSLISAIKHNYIQYVNESAEKDGYIVTVNAVTADENQLILLYTAKSLNGQEIYGMNSVKLSSIATGKPLGHSRNNGTHDADSENVFRGTTTIRLKSREPFPQEIAAKFQIASVDDGRLSDPVTNTSTEDMHYSPTLLIHFSLAGQFKRPETEIVYPNHIIQLGDHKVALTRVEMSPLEMRVRFTSDQPFEPYNTKKSWVEATGIIAGEGDQAVLLRALNRKMAFDDPNSYEYIFYSNLLDQPKTLQLQVVTREADNIGDTQLIQIK